MKECIYRITVKKQTDGVSQAFSKAVVGTIPGVSVVRIEGSLQQTFCNGLCKLLTANDIGPVECQQPDHCEKDCPDIKDIK